MDAFISGKGEDRGPQEKSALSKL